MLVPAQAWREHPHLPPVAAPPETRRRPGRILLVHGGDARVAGLKKSSCRSFCTLGAAASMRACSCAMTARPIGPAQQRANSRAVSVSAYALTPLAANARASFKFFGGQQCLISPSASKRFARALAPRVDDRRLRRDRGLHIRGRLISGARPAHW